MRLPPLFPPFPSLPPGPGLGDFFHRAEGRRGWFGMGGQSTMMGLLVLTLLLVILPPFSFNRLLQGMGTRFELLSFQFSMLILLALLIWVIVGQIRSRAAGRPGAPRSTNFITSATGMNRQALLDLWTCGVSGEDIALLILDEGQAHSRFHWRLMCWYLAGYVALLTVRGCLLLDFQTAVAFGLSAAPIIAFFVVLPRTLAGAASSLMMADRSAVWERQLLSRRLLALVWGVSLVVGGCIGICGLLAVVRVVAFLYVWHGHVDDGIAGPMQQFATAIDGPMALVGLGLLVCLPLVHHFFRWYAQYEIRRMGLHLPRLIELIVEERK
ncbi:hypothetical protein GC173_16470 [bacterium]|nr:hypothetical protein [bacterium]